MQGMPRLGVAGAGYWGTNLIQTAADMGVLGAVYDPEPERLIAMRWKHPDIPALREYAQLLDAVDAVVIAAPASLHADLALTAIAARKHVFVEKPLALSVADAERIADAADRMGVRSFVGHILLYHPAVRALRDDLSRGTIGEIRHVRSRRLNLGKVRDHENVWWSFAPHDISLVLALMDETPQDVTGSLRSVRGVAVEDFAYADFAFSQGRSAHVEVSWLDPNRSARLDVFGTRGVLTFEDSRSGATVVRRKYEVSADLQTTSGEPESIPFEGDRPLRIELEAFVSAIRDGAAVLTDARHGAEVVRVLERIDKPANISHSLFAETAR